MHVSNTIFWIINTFCHIILVSGYQTMSLLSLCNTSKDPQFSSNVFVRIPWAISINDTFFSHYLSVVFILRLLWQVFNIMNQTIGRNIYLVQVHFLVITTMPFNPWRLKGDVLTLTQYSVSVFLCYPRSKVIELTGVISLWYLSFCLIVVS